MSTDPSSSSARARRRDVLVVGAGPGGCAAGTVLAEAGIDVCVLDRATFPRDKVCGDAVSVAAVDCIAALGAGEALRRVPHALVDTAAVIFPDGTRTVRRLGDRANLIVPRYHLDNVLRERLQAVGAELVQGARVVRLLEEGGRVCGAETADGRRWYGKVVIAADGPGSVAWRSGSRPYARPRQLALAATVYLRGVRDEDAPACARHFFDAELPCGYGWVFPAVDGVANVGVYQRSDLYKQRAVPLRTLLEGFLSRYPQLFEGTERVGPVRSWSLPLGVDPHPSAEPGLIRVGDAGGFVDPLTGEGIWQAIFSGMMAGRVVAATLAARGELAATTVARYRAAVFWHLRLRGEVRAGIQDLLSFLVNRRLYERAAVRQLLEWGYQSHSQSRASIA